MRKFLAVVAVLAGVAAQGTAGVTDDEWHGAQWIGAGDELPLYPQYLPVFKLECSFESNGLKNTVFFGANDERLSKSFLNKEHVEAAGGTSYIALELDGKQGKARLLRRNYTDNEELATIISEADYTEKKGTHKIDISCSLGNIEVDVDGQRLFAKGVNPYGNGGDYMAYPVLADIGLTSDGHIKGVFTVRNFRSPNAVLTTIEGLAAAPGDTVFTSPAITGQPLLRSSLKIEKKLRKATVKSSARGIYTLKINGKRSSDEYFAPGASQYNRTHYYDTADITGLLSQGDNTLEVQLAEGWWYGPATFIGDNWNFYGDRPSFLSLIVLEYEDGSVEYVPGKASRWEYSTDGPLVCGSFFQGEIYNAGAKADKMTWHPAKEIPLDGTTPKKSPDTWPMPGDYSDWRFIETYGPGVSAVDTLTAVSITRPRPGVFIYDMGQNHAGAPLICFRNTDAGKTVSMRYAEVLYPTTEKYASNAGEMMMENIRAAMAQDKYIAAGAPVETFSPRSTFHGYRYIEITGIDEALPLDDVRSVALSSIPRMTAHFECSDSSLNRLWKNIEWSTRSNFISVPTDCPQRNERMGWSGDISVFTPSANYLADADLFLRRHMQTMRDCQRPDGRFPDIAPTGFGFGGFLWGSAGIVLPYECWRHYGDTAIIAENYAAMKRYMDYVAEKCIDKTSGLLVQSRQWGDLGDWLSPEHDRNDKSLIWEAYYINCLRMMAEMAEKLGYNQDAENFGSLRENRISFFKNTYIDPETRKTRFSAFEPAKQGRPVDTQISYVLPIAFSIVDPTADKGFAENFLTTVRRTSIADDGRECPLHSLMTGFIGTAQIMNAMSACGAVEDAYELLTSHGYPSWLYPVDQGATSIWERLNSYTIHDGFGTNNSMNSFNHYSFGAVAQWLMSTCAGIRRCDEGCGFAEFILEPTADPRPDGISYVSASYDSPWGTISSSWIKTGSGVIYKFEIPEGCSARLRLPDSSEKILKSGKYSFTI